MNPRSLNTIGLVLLVAFFAMAGWRVLTRAGLRMDSSVTVLRFAHNQLQPGIREAFDEIAADYMRLHPHVRIEQISVPLRAWEAWLRTQLVGETAPDVIEIATATDEMLARYFEPLTPWVDSPNPYNADTALADTPWRTTFLDGLTNPPSYNPGLMEFYGVPTSITTIRLACNEDMLRAITGSTRLPATYEEFVALCRAANDYARRTGQSVSAIAGSADSASQILIRLFASQTQQLGLQLDPFSTLNITVRESAPAYLRGVWSLRDPAIQSGLNLWREIGAFIQPGFLQLKRDDAQFYFSHGHALFIGVSSRDLEGVSGESHFPVVITDIPLPSHRHPHYGRHVLGTVSEASKALDCCFGLNREGKNKKQALDFLRFLTSEGSARKYARIGNRLPAITGVPVNPGIVGFLPMMTGRTNGFGIHFTNYGGSNTQRLYQKNLDKLFSPNGGVEEFTSALEADYHDHLVMDIEHMIKTTRLNLMRGDTTHAAYRYLAHADPAESYTAKLSLLLETQNLQEAEMLQLSHTLARASKPATSQ